MSVLAWIYTIVGILLIGVGVILILLNRENGDISLSLGKSRPSLKIKSRQVGLITMGLGVLLLMTASITEIQIKSVRIEFARLTEERQTLLTQYATFRTNTASKIGSLNEDVKLARARKAKIPNIKGLSKEAAIALIKQSGLEAGKVQEGDTLFVADILKKAGYEAHVGPIGTFFITPDTKDTIVIKPNTIYLQNPPPGEIVPLKEKIDFRIIKISPKEDIPQPAYPVPEKSEISGGKNKQNP